MENDEEGGVPKMKKMALLLCAVLFICTCAACSMEKKTISVAYDLSASPKNIDPQNASTQDAAILLRHIMQGLYHIDSDGNVQKALAEDTSVSEDGKTYTVTIRKNIAQSIPRLTLTRKMPMKRGNTALLTPC